VPPALFLVPFDEVYLERSREARGKVKKMINTILGKKLETNQKFDAQEKRMPVTLVEAGPCYVVQVKTKEKDGYNAVKLSWGEKKAPVFLREVRLVKIDDFKVGDEVKIDSVFKPGDKVKVTGQAKGKGFAGVVKRWGFKSGPKTHGQSDRERAPGSIGLGTTPGRVFKGKKMPGRAGGQKVTVSGLVVVSVDEKNNLLGIRGLLPGHKNSFLLIRKQNG